VLPEKGGRAKEYPVDRELLQFLKYSYKNQYSSLKSILANVIER